MIHTKAVARAWFGATAFVVLAGLVLQVHASWTSTFGYFDSAPARVANMLCFFTIQSNLIVMVTTALLAVSPADRGRVFAVFRLVGVVGITITFVVFHVALSGLHDLEGTAKVADQLLHAVAPIMCVLGWLVFGPRGLVDHAIVKWSLLYPVLWLVGTLIRGAATGFYPYPFLDVGDHGVARVGLNVFVVAVVFVGATYGAWGLDRVVPPNGSHRARDRDHAR